MELIREKTFLRSGLYLFLVFMYVFVCDGVVFTSVYVFTCDGVCIHMCLCMYSCVMVYVFTCVYVFVCDGVWTHAFVYVFTVFVHVFTCDGVCIHL